MPPCSIPRNPKWVGGRLSTHTTTEIPTAAVSRACKKAGVPHWSPHRLRHTNATAVRQEFGIEAAQVVLGHRSSGTTEIYAERDLGLVIEVMKKLG